MSKSSTECCPICGSTKISKRSEATTYLFQVAIDATCHNCQSSWEIFIDIPETAEISVYHDTGDEDVLFA